jgi:hypothetical protein
MVDVSSFDGYWFFICVILAGFCVGVFNMPGTCAIIQTIGPKLCLFLAIVTFHFPDFTSTLVFTPHFCFFWGT